MQTHRQSPTSGGEDGNGAGLSSPHDSSDVVLTKHSLNGHSIGAEGV
jgi:hypothetical protein